MVTWTPEVKRQAAEAIARKYLENSDLQELGDLLDQWRDEHLGSDSGGYCWDAMRDVFELVAASRVTTPTMKELRDAGVFHVLD